MICRSECVNGAQKDHFVDILDNETRTYLSKIVYSCPEFSITIHNIKVIYPMI